MSNFIVTCGGCHQGQGKKGVDFGYTAFLKPLNKLVNYNSTQFVDFRNDKYFNDPVYGSFVMGNNIIHTFHKNSDMNIADTSLITLGGDHTISFGSICAARELYGRIKVIWIDAHPDINTPTSSLSGNCHGMPVAYLFNIAHHHNINLTGPVLSKSDLVYIGLRSIDEFESKLIDSNNIVNYNASTVKSEGISKILENLEKQFIGNDSKKYKIHVSLDIDSIDPEYTPSTGTPEPGGLTPSDIKEIINFANKHSLGNCNLDITEVNPLLSDVEGACKTYSVCNDIMDHYVGITTNIT
jgi:arginase